LKDSRNLAFNFSLIIIPLLINSKIFEEGDLEEKEVLKYWIDRLKRGYFDFSNIQEDINTYQYDRKTFYGTNLNRYKL
jgi:hypothetical protein